MFIHRPFKIFIATIFSFALMFPIAIQTAHALDGHEHQVCNDFSTHLHKKQLDCSICDFHFSSFDFKPQQLPEFSYVFGQNTAQNEYREAEILQSAPHFFLRGPPSIS
ncbi:hypothetical protein EI546_01130 [Aequorivita sp. H23M31]|uniref:DUF2946 domain-containing protein n=1 Tax=Aequorivita ciconiae TaxID=2494375 RepID=A0A410FZG5_9FLAO|nr:hypothetical protein [Aequorivita sp. H23M31]QAA80417.1 hypothetical protein EI546_01130 [Aequorivita sp. H23M31]